MTAFLAPSLQCPFMSRRESSCSFLHPHRRPRSRWPSPPPLRACADPGRPGAPLPLALAELAASLVATPPGAPRYLALIALACPGPESLPALDCTPDTRVPGCTSVAHMRVRVGADRRVHLAGTADAQVARGLVALLARGLSGASVADVLSLSVPVLNHASGLDVAVAPTRAVGLASLLAFVQNRVRQLDGETIVESSSRNGVGLALPVTAVEDVPMKYTAVQPEDVAVLLSGGVDSSVAMRLVMDAGYRPHPFYLKIWLEDELAHLGECPWEEDMEFATAVCDQAGVSLESVPLQREYWDRVVTYTIAEARAGRTPNPDVMCNTRVKFGAFYDVVGQYFPRVVTGHYARSAVDPETGLAQLAMSDDLVKDQTYFLAHLSQSQVARALFPVGQYTKDQIRELATAKYMLPNRSRKDSQGICFLGKLKFDDFLEHHLGSERGPLVEFESGIALGVHRGFWFYTTGQRKGLGLSGGPWYVVAKDATENVVYVSRNYHDVDKARDAFDFADSSWIAGSWPSQLRAVGFSTELRVKTRHGPRMNQCVVTRTGASTGHVALALRDIGLAPGQFAVFYSLGNICLGSGVIANDLELSRAHRKTGAETSVQLQAHNI
jgi:tRNA-5-taurinomethyluridine 2-sulfurtransferase